MSNNKPPKRPADMNQLARFIVDAASGEIPAPTPKQTRGKKGGEVGGAARARILTPAERSEIARIAAEARWKKSD